MLQGSGINLVEVDDVRQPLRVDFDNVYLDKRVNTDSVNVLAFAAGLSDDVNVSSKGPKTFKTIALSHVAKVWNRVFAYLENYMENMSHVSEENGLDVFQRLCQNDLPDYIRKCIKVTSRREVANQAISIVFDFTFEEVTSSNVRRSGGSYVISGLWDASKQIYIPCKSPNEKGKCSATLNKGDRPLTSSEFAHRIKPLNERDMSYYGIGVRYIDLANNFCCEDLIKFPSYDYFEEGSVRKQQIDSLGYCKHSDLHLHIPAVEITKNVIKFGSYDVVSGIVDNPQHLSHVVRNKYQEWSETKQAKYMLSVTAEEAKTDLIAFIEGCSDNVMLNSLVNIWHTEGGLAFMNNVRNDCETAVIQYDKMKNSVQMLGCMLKEDRKEPILVYGKNVKNPSVRSKIERAFVAFKLM